VCSSDLEGGAGMTWKMEEVKVLPLVWQRSIYMFTGKHLLEAVV